MLPRRPRSYRKASTPESPADSEEDTQVFETPGTSPLPSSTAARSLRPSRLAFNEAAEDEEEDEHDRTVVHAPSHGEVAVPSASPLLAPGWPPGTSSQSSHRRSTTSKHVRTISPSRPATRSSGMDTKAADQSAKEAGEAHTLRQQQAKTLVEAANRLDVLVQDLTANPRPQAQRAAEFQIKRLKEDMTKLNTAENMYLAAAETHNRISNPTWDDEKHERVLLEEGKWIDQYETAFQEGLRRAEEALIVYEEQSGDGPDSTHDVIDLRDDDDADSGNADVTRGPATAEQQAEAAATVTAETVAAREEAAHQQQLQEAAIQQTREQEERQREAEEAEERMRREQQEREAAAAQAAAADRERLREEAAQAAIREREAAAATAAQQAERQRQRELAQQQEDRAAADELAAAELQRMEAQRQARAAAERVEAIRRAAVLRAQEREREQQRLDAAAEAEREERRRVRAAAIQMARRQQGEARAAAAAAAAAAGGPDRVLGGPGAVPEGGDAQDGFGGAEGAGAGVRGGARALPGAGAPGGGPPAGNGGNGGGPEGLGGALAAPAGSHLEALVAQLVLALTDRERASRDASQTTTDRLVETLAEDRKAAAEIQARTVQLLRTPRMDCPVFSGKDSEDYANWKIAFQQVYPVTMLPRERFLGLQTKIAGAAKELMAGLAAADFSYAEAMGRLDEKYGRPEQVIARLNRLFKAEKPVSKVEDPGPLRSLFEKIRSMVATYKALNEPLSGPFMIETWLEKLPRSVARAWAKATLDDAKVEEDLLDAAGNVIRPGNGLVKKGGNVDEFMKIVEDQVRLSESMWQLTKATREAKEEEKKSKETTATKKQNSASLLTTQDGQQADSKKTYAGAVASGASGGKGSKKQPNQQQGQQQQQQGQPGKKTHQKATVTCNDCKVSKAGHLMATCPIFLKQTPVERRRWAWDLNRCKKCLQQGHFGKDCPQPVKCTASVCQFRDSHHTILHLNMKTKN